MSTPRERLIGFVIDGRPSRRDLGQIRYNIYTGYYEKGKRFATNPIIREVIKSHFDKLGTQIGFFRIIVNQHEQMIWMNEVNPFGQANARLVDLTGKGIATLLELVVEKDLAARFPGYEIHASAHPSKERRRQLKRRGRSNRESIPIEEAVKLTRSKVVGDFQKKQRPIRYYWGKIKSLFRWRRRAA